MLSRWSDYFSVAQFFLKLVWQIGEDGMLVWLGKEKKLTRCLEKQLSMDNIQMDLD